MGLITDLLLFPVTGPVRGLMFVLGAIRDEADAMRASPDRVRADLTELELRRDLGEISDAEYDEQERILLEQLNAYLSGQETRYTSGEGSPPEDLTLEADQAELDPTDAETDPDCSAHGRLEPGDTDEETAGDSFRPANGGDA
jgi:hypothetical protein